MAGVAFGYHITELFALDAPRAGQRYGLISGLRRLAAFRALAADRMPDDLFAANNIYVTCQIDEDLPWILKAIMGVNISVLTLALLGIAWVGYVAVTSGEM